MDCCGQTFNTKKRGGAMNMSENGENGDGLVDGGGKGD